MCTDAQLIARLAKGEMMAFTEDQKSTIREIAYEVGKAISSQIKEDRAKDLHLHTVECPMARDFTKWKARAGGFIAAFTLIGGLVGTGIIFIAQRLWEHFAKN